MKDNSAFQESAPAETHEARVEPIIDTVSLIDYIPGNNVKHTPKEHMRQFLAKALEQEYGMVLEDMQADFRVGSGKNRRLIGIALFHPKRGHSALNLSRAVICRPIYRKVVDDDLPVIGAAHNTFRERAPGPGR